MLIIKIFKIKCSNPSRILNEHWCIYSCLQIPPRENWFKYMYAEYTKLQLTFLTLQPCPYVCTGLSTTDETLITSYSWVGFSLKGYFNRFDIGKNTFTHAGSNGRVIAEEVFLTLWWVSDLKMHHKICLDSNVSCCLIRIYKEMFLHIFSPRDKIWHRSSKLERKWL